VAEDTYHDFQNYAWKAPLVKAQRGRWRSSGGNPFSTIPALLFAPTITGIPTQGQQLTADGGTWTQLPPLLHGPPFAVVGTNPPSTTAIVTQPAQPGLYPDGMPAYEAFFQWMWLRNGTPIPGAPGPFYTLTSADVGQAITVQVQTSNPVGSSSPAFAKAVTPAATLAISGTPVTSATHNVPYAGFTVGATGGWAPYLFNLVAGNWPHGVSLNARTGLVSGTPTQTGTFAGLVVQVTDLYGLTANLASFTLTVA
jgi:hypothetical protein